MNPALYAEIEPLNNLQIAEFNIKPIEYSIIVPCNNEDFIIEVNKAIDEIKESPLYDNLYKKHFAIKDKTKIKITETESNLC